MKKKEIEKKYKNYIQLLKKYNLFYFSNNDPLVSDSDYDKLKRDISVSYTHLTLPTTYHV